MEKAVLCKRTELELKSYIVIVACILYICNERTPFQLAISEIAQKYSMNESLLGLFVNIGYNCYHLYMYTSSQDGQILHHHHHHHHHCNYVHSTHPPYNCHYHQPPVHQCHFHHHPHHCHILQPSNHQLIYQQLL